MKREFLGICKAVQTADDASFYAKHAFEYWCKYALLVSMLLSAIILMGIGIARNSNPIGICGAALGGLAYLYTQASCTRWLNKIVRAVVGFIFAIPISCRIQKVVTGCKNEIFNFRMHIWEMEWGKDNGYLLNPHDLGVQQTAKHARQMIS